jgi:flavin-binding protein dodecin
MNDLNVSLAAVLDSPAVDDTPTVAAQPAQEFVGASDDTIAEAVRRALSLASLSLRTLEGAGVVVIPQIDRHGASPRFHVTLRVSPSATVDGAAPSHA